MSWGLIAEVGFATWTMLWLQSDAIHKYVEQLPALGRSTTVLLFAALLFAPLACGIALARHRLTKGTRTLAVAACGSFALLMLAAGFLAAAHGGALIVTTVVIAVVPTAAIACVLVRTK